MTAARAGRYAQPGRPSDSRWVYNSYQLGGQRRLDQQTGQVAVIEPPRRPDRELRYNWITPLVLSPHNPQILYTGAQVLFDRSIAATRGRRSARCSPRRTRRPADVRISATSPIAHNDHRRIARACRRDLGGHRRWPRARHPRSWGDVVGPDVSDRRRRRSRTAM